MPNMTWDIAKNTLPLKLYAGAIPWVSNTTGLSLRPLYKEWIGLSIEQNDSVHILHDITTKFPLEDNIVDAFQAEDVLEHIPYEKMENILLEVYRVLKPGGYFRISVPDYRCDYLLNRSEKDSNGKVTFDPGGGGSKANPGHKWFPTIESAKNMVKNTKFECEYLHYYNEDGTYVTNKIDYSKGHVVRTPDHCVEVQTPFRPLSLIMDCYK